MHYTFVNPFNCYFEKKKQSPQFYPWSMRSHLPDRQCWNLLRRRWFAGFVRTKLWHLDISPGISSQRICSISSSGQQISTFSALQCYSLYQACRLPAGWPIWSLFPVCCCWMGLRKAMTTGRGINLTSRLAFQFYDIRHHLTCHLPDQVVPAKARHYESWELSFSGLLVYDKLNTSSSHGDK